jgi:hypothetical protein
MQKKEDKAKGKARGAKKNFNYNIYVLIFF